MSLAVSGASAIRSQAKTAQARNDCTGLSQAIRSFYTDYSRYPIPLSKQEDTIIEASQSDSGNSQIVKALVGKDADINPRGIAYYDPKSAKKGSSGGWTGGMSPDGAMFDPWGYTFGVCVDGDYDGALKYSGSSLKYFSASPGDVEDSVWKQISGGVGVFSLGRDQCTSSKGSFAPGILSWY